MELIKAVIAGMFISLGAYANMKFGGVIGAVLFSLGLLSVIKLKTPLFTGMVATLSNYMQHRMDKILAVNIITAFICGLVVLSMPGFESRIDVLAKYDKTAYEFLFDAILCGICVGIAAKTKETIMVIMAVTFFVLCGGEHCIADMFYFAASGNIDVKAFGSICGAIVGNMNGGFIVGITDLRG